MPWKKVLFKTKKVKFSEEKNSSIICIAQLIRCENTENYGYTIQNISTPLGFCGLTTVNLFGKSSCRYNERSKLSNFI